MWGGGGGGRERERDDFVVCFFVCVFYNPVESFAAWCYRDYISGESANTNKINYLGISSSDVN